MRLHHAGIATDDLDRLSDLYRDLLEMPVVHEEDFDGMQIAYLDAGWSYLELLEPESGGAIERYLEDHGPGIHHLAFQTDDLSDALARARDLGVDLVDEESREGAWEHQVAFLHPGSTGGILIEFVEDAA